VVQGLPLSAVSLKALPAGRAGVKLIAEPEGSDIEYGEEE
jgi:hypothetical protein